MSQRRKIVLEINLAITEAKTSQSFEQCLTNTTNFINMRMTTKFTFDYTVFISSSNL